VAIERVLVESIAKAVKSVVAIARVRKPRAEEAITFEFRPSPFGRRAGATAPPQPTDPDFIPNEYGTGVVVDAHGLILTSYRLLAIQSLRLHYVEFFTKFYKGGGVKFNPLSIRRKYTKEV
jgi:hypothetical protein